MNKQTEQQETYNSEGKTPCWLCKFIGKLTIIGIYLALFAAFFYFPLIIKIFRDDKTLNVCAFTETFAPEAIALFEKETGIKVNVTYVESDEQIYAKFTINQGDGYDIIHTSDYMVHLLAEGKYLTPLDHNQIPNQKNIYPHFFKKPYDKDNRYSLPHKWYIYGLVYDKEFFKQTPDQMSLDYIFKNPHTLYSQNIVPSPYKLCMIDDARDAVLFASIYLYGGFKIFTQQELQQITDLLIHQKTWVEGYTSRSVQYFLFTNIVPIALTSSDYMRKIWKNSDRFDFAIPKEGSMLVIENMAIPKSSKKVALAHQFINFMLSTKIATINSMTYGYTSANQEANAHFGPTMLKNPHVFPDNQMFKRLHILLLPPSLRAPINHIWLEVGFA